MKRRWIAFTLASVLTYTFCTPQAARAEVSAEQVRASINKAITFLKKQQRANGTWLEVVSQEGGSTSLITLALLNAGVPVNDPTIQRSLQFLRTIDPKRTYATSLQTMVFCVAEPSRDKFLIDRNVKWLDAQQFRDGSPYDGGWGYGSGPDTGVADNSNTQFALLALHEAERVGVRPRTNLVWIKAKQYLMNGQKADGSWPYRVTGGESTGSMTSAGIAGMVIVSGKQRSGDALVSGNRIVCCRNEKSDEATRIEAGLRWLGENFSVRRNPGTAGNIWLYYYLYALERVGRLTAQRHFENADGDRFDWYREGCDYLVRTQDQMSGYWLGEGRSEKSGEITTALALLFLSKGRRPNLISKLKHPPDANWNIHRADIGNLTREVEDRWRMNLTWQVVDLRLASVEDLLQSPVLYYSGSKNPVDDATIRATADKIRGYLDRGGFIIAEADCGGAGFDQGFRKLLSVAFPEPEYRLRPISPEHPIWHADAAKVAPEDARLLLGLEYGCRTSLVYVPPDPQNPRPSLSCLWELSSPPRGEEYSPEVQRQIDSALAIGSNILAYATGRQIKDKVSNFDLTTAPPPEAIVDRGRLQIAKLRHAGGCDAAPRALIHLLETASKELKINVAAREELIRISDDALWDYHLVFMHGRNRFQLTDLERRRLKTYLERGGTLVADSICASSSFTESFRDEMATIFPENPIEPIPAEDPMWSNRYGGERLQNVARHEPVATAPGQPMRMTRIESPPRLEGIKIGDRWAVIFSPLDISCALERHNSIDCRGYTQESAARIALNIILYSLGQ